MSTQKITGTNAQASILVVDDEPGIRNLLRDFLSGEFKVCAVASADEAARMLEKDKFDIVISDVHMPGMSGKEFFSLCMKQYPEMQFMLMTGRPEFGDAINTVKDGAFYYLLKPLDLNLLHSLVMKALEQKNNGSRRAESATGIIKNLGSKYRVVRSLGAGTSGVVLLVESKGELYAMKLLRYNKADDNYLDKVKRFKREAEVLMRIDNEHVVRIIEHNLGKTDETPFIIMEYVEGIPLDEFIDGNSIDFHQKISIIRQIADTLACVHSHGVIHRDIKPANILVTGDLSVKITDFGVCHVSDSSLTMCDESLGSPAYMAPESFELGKKPDAKFDIFSLGVICYEMFTGIRPFEEETIIQTISLLKNKRPVAPLRLNAEIPVWMQDVMAKMLDKNPDRRFKSCREVSETITHCLSGGGGKKDLNFAAKMLNSVIPGDPVWG